MSQNVYFESRDQSLAGQLAVAQITMNRVSSPNYPNDVCSVVYEYKQFSWYWDGKTDRPYNEDAWEQAQLVASAAMAGSGHISLERVTHYHSVFVQPYWSHKLEYVTQIGNHKFYQ